jgi:hypothetical protein
MVKNRCEMVDTTGIHNERKFWTNESIVRRNEKILSVLTGLGYGILLFLFISFSIKKDCKTSSQLMFLIFGLFLTVLSSMMINLNKNNSSLEANEQSNLIYGLLGTGIGILIFLILDKTLLRESARVNFTVMSIIISIIVMTLSSLIISNNNNCDTTKNVDYPTSSYNTVAGIFISLCIINIIVVVYLAYKKIDSLPVISSPVITSFV